MKHTELAIRRPIGTVMIFVALALIGLIATRLLPLEKWPDIEFPGIFIQVPYPGSTPEEIERRITRPIEETLATLTGVERMQSSSSDSQAQIFLQFGWDQDVSTRGIDARAKIDAIRDDLPADIQNFFIFTGSLADQPILAIRISSDRDLSDAYDLLDRNLKRPIERMDGVSKVELHGVDPREIRILLDADRLAAHKIDVRVLRDLLKKSNFAVSAGRITDAGQRFSIRPQGEFESLDDIRNVVINNNDLRLGDVAEVTLRSPERNYGRHLDRKYAIGLQVYKSTGANMVDVADRVLAEVDRVSRLPQMQGINIFNLENQADNVKDSLSDLTTSGLIGALLAICVLYFFLRQLTTTLIITLAVPFSLLITLAAMYFLGLSLNILSLMGLMLAVGMLVDNGVVVTESIFRYRQDNPGQPKQATLHGVRDVGLAVITGTMTSIIVFVPIMFGTRTNITIFLTHVAITISVAMAASLIIAQTLIPMLAARIPPPPVAKQGALMNRIIRRYGRALDRMLRHPWIMALLIVLTIASTAIPIKLIKFDAFPQETARRLYLPYHIDASYPLERVEGAVDRIEDYLYSHQEELNIITVYSWYTQDDAQSTILFTPEEEATRSTKDIIEQIEEELPEIIIGKPSFKFDQAGGGEGFSIQLSGDSGEELAVLAEDVVRILSTVDGLQDVRADSTAGEREVRVVVDRERAAQVGLDPQSVAASVAIAMRGEYLREFRGADGEINVRLAFRDDDQESLEHLAGLPLYTPSGGRIALGTVANFEIQRGKREIKRVNRATSVVIEANTDEATLEELKPKVERLLNEYDLPPGYFWKFGRGFDENDQTQAMMMTNIILGVAMIFLVMAALFESVLYPISIITSILFSVIGVFWFFFLTGTTFSFMASIGIMILIGVVVNNGIVLVDHVNNLRSRGMARNEAILTAGHDRLRPILMTVATTILGLLPLAVGTTQIGGDGPPYFPMARAIIGGLAFSTLTSLFVVPYVYVLVDSLAKWWRKAFRFARGETLRDSV